VRQWLTVYIECIKPKRMASPETQFVIMKFETSIFRALG